MIPQRFTIYAIREVGTIEPRYIGQTSRGPECRLNRLIWEARNCSNLDIRFYKWLRENRHKIEAIEVSTAETRDEAKAQERLLIQSLANMGFRLFNRDHMPRALKLDRAA